MKRIIVLIFSILVAFSAIGQNIKGYYVEAYSKLEAKRAFVIDLDTFYATTQLNENDTILATRGFVNSRVIDTIATDINTANWIDFIENYAGSGTGDNWGTQVVNRDGTLIGNGVTPLGVDSTKIQTVYAAKQSQYWTRGTSSIYPKNISDEVRIGGSTDLGDHKLQVSGKSYLKGNVAGDYAVKIENANASVTGNGLLLTTNYNSATSLDVERGQTYFRALGTTTSPTYFITSASDGLLYKTTYTTPITDGGTYIYPTAYEDLYLTNNKGISWRNATINPGAAANLWQLIPGTGKFNFNYGSTPTTVMELFTNGTVSLSGTLSIANTYTFPITDGAAGQMQITDGFGGLSWSTPVTLSSFSSTATGLTYTNTTGVFSLTSGYAIPTTAKQTNWDNAYTHSIITAGSVHGSSTVGGNFFRLTNPSAITFPRINADNTVSALSATDFKTALGITGSGTVTSVAMTVPTGLTVTGSPITSSGTLALTMTSGYSIPTTANQTNWTAAYNDKINSLAFSGTTTKTLTLTQQDGGTVTGTFTDLGGSTDLSFSGATSPITLNSSTGTDVTISAGTNIGLTATGTNITISNTMTPAPNGYNTSVGWNGANKTLTVSDGGGDKSAVITGFVQEVAVSSPGGFITNTTTTANDNAALYYNGITTSGNITLNSVSNTNHMSGTISILHTTTNAYTITIYYNLDGTGNDYTAKTEAGSGQVVLTTGGNGYVDVLHWEYAGGTLFVTHDIVH